MSKKSSIFANPKGRAKWDNEFDEDSDEFGFNDLILLFFIVGAIAVVFFS